MIEKKGLILNTIPEKIVHPRVFRVTTLKSNNHTWPNHSFNATPTYNPKVKTSFAVSYDLFIGQKDVFVLPQCRVWSTVGERVDADAPHQHKMAFRDFGEILFGFLENEDIRDDADAQLRKMAEGSIGEVYHFVLCNDGALLIAEDVAHTWYAFGKTSAVAAFLPTNCHNEAHALKNLKSCMEAIVRYQHQDKGQNLIRIEYEA